MFISQTEKEVSVATGLPAVRRSLYLLVEAVEQPKPLGRKEAATVVLSLYNQTLAAAGRPPDNGLRGGTEGAVGPWRFSG